MTAYSTTGANPALSATQFLEPVDPAYAWNLTVWDILTMGAPIDAPDHISAGACNSGWAIQMYIQRDAQALDKTAHSM